MVGGAAAVALGVATWVVRTRWGVLQVSAAPGDVNVAVEL
jgi:hypothetical protein